MRHRRTSRRRIVEVFVDGGRRGRELLNRLFSFRLRNCTVQIREVNEVAHPHDPGLPNQIRVDGRTLPVDDNGRVPTDVLHLALFGEGFAVPVKKGTN